MKTGAGGAAPARAGIVLATLILVATVANLNLSVANVALPSIAKAFDSPQTRLDLIAVGYSLGLAASVLYLGALGDRYGRKLMLVLGTALAIPASLLAAFAPSRPRALRRARVRRPRRRHGLPHHAGADHGALVGSAEDARHRPVVRRRRRHGRGRAAVRRAPDVAVLVGVRLPAHAPPGGPGRGAGRLARAGARQRDHRARRPPRRRALRRLRRRPDPGHQPDHGARTRPSSRSRCSSSPSWASPSSSSGSGALPTRCSTCTWPPAGCSGWRPAPASSCSAR